MSRSGFEIRILEGFHKRSPPDNQPLVGGVAVRVPPKEHVKEESFDGNVRAHKYGAKQEDARYQ